MREINIIGCGSSAADWNGQGESIGVNDCWKYGNATDYLLIVNSANKFTPERLEIIKHSRPKMTFSHLGEWRDIVPSNFQLISINRWNGQLMTGHIHHAETSPFVAMSWAYRQGYNKMILWGVDFVDHWCYNPKLPTEDYGREVKCYKELFDCLRLKGIEIEVNEYSNLRAL